MSLPTKDKRTPPAPPKSTAFPGFSGIWMGWRWKNGKPTEPAPPVSR